MRPELERLIDRVVVPILVARYIRGLNGNSEWASRLSNDL